MASRRDFLKGAAALSAAQALPALPAPPVAFPAPAAVLAEIPGIFFATGEDLILGTLPFTAEIRADRQISDQISIYPE